MKKRILPLILICIIMIGMSFTIVTNAEEPSCIIRGDSVTAIPNSDVTLTLTIENNPGISGAEIIVSFDERLTLINAVAGDAFSALTYVEPSYYRNPTIFVWDSEKINNEDIKDGVILSLTFHTPSGVEDDFPITISYESGNIFDKDLNSMELATVNGCISSISYLPGDADGNGRLNTLDITAIRRYISDGRQTDPNGYNVAINENAADVDGNGRINTLDITKIRRYISDGRKTDPNGYNIALVPGQMSCAHNLVATSAKSPTCTEEGNLGYWYCDKCDKYFSDAEAKYETTLNNTILGTTEHTPGQWVVDQESSCSQVGAKHQICSVCGATIDTDTIPLSDHSYSTEWSYDDTYHWYAANCVHTSEVKNKAAHRWNAGVVTSEATVYDEGIKLYTCQDCGYTKEETIAKISSFTVVFYDSDNKIISKNNYELNTASSQIVIPTIQAEEGFQFEAWINIYDSKSVAEIDFSKAQENAVYQFKPTFVKIHEVVFIDYEGNQLGETLVVKDGDKLNANALPTIPSRTGYTSKWDEQILSTKITETKVFAPVYEVVTFEVTFLDAKNGNEIATRMVEYGSFAIIPECDLYRFNTKLYGFTGWKSSATDTFVENVNGNKLTNVYSNLTVYAVYEESIEQPVLAVHIDGTTVTMSLCIPDGSSLYSINMSMGWVTEKGICEVTGATVSSVTPLNKGNCGEENCTVYTDKVDWLVYNNKAKTIDFIWSCGNGHSFNTSTNVITLTFGVDDGAQITEAIFSMLDGSNVVYGENSASINGLKKSNITIWFY